MVNLQSKLYFHTFPLPHCRHLSFFNFFYSISHKSFLLLLACFPFLFPFRYLLVSCSLQFCPLSITYLLSRPSARRLVLIHNVSHFTPRTHCLFPLSVVSPFTQLTACSLSIWYPPLHQLTACSLLMWYPPFTQLTACSLFNVVSPFTQLTACSLSIWYPPLHNSPLWRVCGIVTGSDQHRALLGLRHGVVETDVTRVAIDDDVMASRRSEGLQRVGQLSVGPFVSVSGVHLGQRNEWAAYDGLTDKWRSAGSAQWMAAYDGLTLAWLIRRLTYCLTGWLGRLMD